MSFSTSLLNNHPGINMTSNFNPQHMQSNSVGSSNGFAHLMSKPTNGANFVTQFQPPSTTTETSYDWQSYVSVTAPTDENDYYEVSYTDADGNEITQQINLDEIDGHSSTFAELAVLSSAGYISQDIGTLLESQFMDEDGNIDFDKSVDMLQTVGDTIRDSLNSGDFATAKKYLAEGKFFNDFALGTDENDPVQHFMRMNAQNYKQDLLKILG
ncbi:MAG: hypothetical protein ATN35_03280 [Epulopiscium sp. Nele67-Bin004]|nr:MAG: hypothetical protein ATN35_03280 [Epulopiscium sp. Nele67-Bin004]